MSIVRTEGRFSLDFGGITQVGLYLVRNGAPRQVAATVPSTALGDATFQATLDDNTTAKVTTSHTSPGTVAIAMVPDDPTGVTAWGADVSLADGEAIYGLTERIVDDYADSEIAPKEVGSLDRRGEKVTMLVRPTMSGYAPFHQSSKGYGMLVDGTMPGTYDIGVTQPSTMRVEFEVDPRSHGGSFHLFHGPSHARILDEYTTLTGRPILPPKVVFANWRGRDVYPVGETADYHGVQINKQVADDLNAYERNGIPPGIFHFDRPWAVGTQGYGDFAFDPARFPNTNQMLEAMRDAGWRIDVWTAPWVLDEAGATAKANGWLAPRSDRALDLTNPDAVRWQQDRIVAFLESPDGRYVDGFFMDRGDEADVSSEPTDIYHDGRSGREVHNDYPVLYARMLRGAIDRARPDGSGFLIERPAYTGSQAYVMRWGGDTPSRVGVTLPEVENTNPSTDLGLRSVLISMQRAAFMGTPYWGSDIGGYSPWNDRDLYARWIQVGSVSPLMRFHGQGGAPWASSDANTKGQADPELLEIYKKYVGLHHALAPYLEGLAREAHETGNTIVRPLVFTWPDEAGARNRWDQWTLGTDLLAAPVWKVGQRERSVWFPPGTWVNVWDRSHVVEGPAERTVAAPLDTLPLFVRQGSPVASALPGS